MLSGPDALEVLIFFSNFSSPFSLISIGVMLIVDWRFVVGSSPVDGFVKTDLN